MSKNLALFRSVQIRAALWTLEGYRKFGGYEGRGRKFCASRRPREKIIDEVKASQPAGRGGAGASHRRGEVELRCRAALRCRSTWYATRTKIEPGTAHDREILRFNPHSIIEGMAIGGYAMTDHCGLQSHIRGGEFLARAHSGVSKRRLGGAPTRRGCWGRNIFGVRGRF